MNIEQLIELFKWMTIISVGLLLFSTVAVVLLKNIYSQWHGKLFGISEKNIALMAYGYLGMFKVLIIIFIIVPYLSLLVLM